MRSKHGKQKIRICRWRYDYYAERKNSAKNPSVGSHRSVAAGDLGGYIESEKNLSTSGNAWVKKRSDIFWASIVGSENGTLTVMRGKDGLIVARGCFCGSVEKFLEASAKKHDAKIRRVTNK